jgi:hypothetical protein
VQPLGLGKLMKFIYRIGFQFCNLPTCRLVPQPLYIYMIHAKTHGVYLSLFADDTFLHVTDCKDYVLRNLQQGLDTNETSCEHCSIKVNEHRAQTMRLQYPVAHPFHHSHKIFQYNLQ